MELVKIEGLNPREYEHPLDRNALNVLEKTAGLDLLVRKFFDLGVEKFLRLEFVGSNLKVTPSSFPEIYEILEEACEILNLKTTPEIYVRPDDYFRKLEVSTNNLEGLTVGVEKPLVVISNVCIESFSRSELLFILGCQIGRLKSQHVLYENIGWLFPILSSTISDVMASIPGVGAISSTFTAGLYLALVHWLRMADYTADRAGLLACQDVNSAMTAMAKIAGLPQKFFDSFSLDDFVTQAREFEGFADTTYNKILKVLSLSLRDQAFTIARANELLQWIDSGNYQAILERKTKIHLAPPPSFCRHCGFKLEPSDAFCRNCGQKVST
ncbi:M48 family metallopeptidase [Nostoc sp. LEGE 12450]|uniref:M48 family metallopeptidase n=1 Tax=Nostoc sp. LEGE 12450 TaxID=1828643 RepID=UPI001882C2C8|nr:M48 family metallopeptidase [Nostoc sp. LEGE 12450]MBE8990051.1 M48 family metalloprotease [Nostoc sp. LEGE 12450]